MPDSHPTRRADRIVLRVIAGAQALLSLGFLAATPFLFMYGGAVANPTAYALWRFLWLSGLIVAICLFSVRAWARLLALAWNGAVLWLGVVVLLGERHASGAELAWVTASSLVTAYLLATSARFVADLYRRSNNQRTFRRRALYLAVASTVAVVATRIAYVELHTRHALLSKLDARSGEARCAAAKELAAQGPVAMAALPKLVAMLGETACVERGGDQLPGYIEAIGGIDPFVELIENDSGPAAEKAVGRLMYGRLQHPTTSQLVSVFRDGLHSRDAFVRRVSAEALGPYGISAARAAPELIALLHDRDGGVRIMAANSLGNIRSLDGIAAALASPDSNVRGVAREWQDRIARGDTLYWYQQR